MNAKRFDNIMFKTKTVSARASTEGIEVKFVASKESGTAPTLQGVRPGAASHGPHAQRQEDRG
jgi:hypothetical protein